MQDIRRRQDGTGRQYAALPLLRQADATRVILVTSRGTGRWILPKGWAETRMSGADLAAKEAFEEAGLIGVMQPHSIGAYSYRKQFVGDETLACRVEVFTMEVEALLDDWPERQQRRRQSFTLAEAAAAVAEVELQDLLRSLSRAALPTEPDSGIG